jgi:ribosomal protein S18 acetylase RimI-like enzyme
VNDPVEFMSNTASVSQIAEHLSSCDAEFKPRLSDRIEISTYAQKIFDKTVRFEAWSNSTLIGFVAVYCDDMRSHTAFISSVSVLAQWMGRGVASQMIAQCVKHVAHAGMQQISLEVKNDNEVAIALYAKIGFVALKSRLSSVTMEMKL